MRDFNVLSAVFSSPWLIEPRKARVLAQVALRHAFGGRPSQKEIEDATGEQRAEMNARLVAADRVNALRSGVAVIPIFGVLVHRGALDNSSGMTSTELVAAKFRAAVADPNIQTILLDVDSPGGEVSGTMELAAEIAASPKPVVAVANAMAASAAYWIASAADELVVTPSGEVGSIGVLMIHEDESKALEAEGITRTVIAAGDHKGEMWGPLSEDARAHLEEQAQAMYREFVGAVARNRGVPPAKVKSDFGGGRMLLANDAKAVGMVDRVATFAETAARFAAGGRVTRRRASAGAADVERHRRSLDLQ